MVIRFRVKRKMLSGNGLLKSGGDAITRWIRWSIDLVTIIYPASLTIGEPHKIWSMRFRRFVLLSVVLSVVSQDNIGIDFWPGTVNQNQRWTKFTPHLVLYLGILFCSEDVIQCWSAWFIKCLLLHWWSLLCISIMPMIEQILILRSFVRRFKIKILPLCCSMCPDFFLDVQQVDPMVYRYEKHSQRFRNGFGGFNDLFDRY